MAGRRAMRPMRLSGVRGECAPGLVRRGSGRRGGGRRDAVCASAGARSRPRRRRTRDGPSVPRPSGDASAPTPRKAERWRNACDAEANRAAPRPGGGRCKSIPARIHYSQRPAGAHDRSQAGHWEIDTLMDRGTRHTASALLLVERRSREVRLAPLPQLNAATVCRETIRLLRRQCVRSITADNGGEFARHQRITAALRAPVFFTDPGRPGRPGQRGTCENAAALVRGQPLGGQSPRRLAAVAARINRRPMKTHAWHPRNQAAKPV